MDWEAFGAIAETVQAFGVFGTLLYIAVQMRLTYRDSRIDAHQQITRDYEQHQAAVADDQNVGIFIKGLNSYSDLTPTERVKFEFWIGGHINLIEETLYHEEGGKLAEWDHDKKGGIR